MDVVTLIEELKSYPPDSRILLEVGGNGAIHINNLLHIRREDFPDGVVVLSSEID